MLNAVKLVYILFRDIYFSITSFLSKFIMNIMSSNVNIGENFSSKGILILDLKKNSIVEFGSSVIFNNATSQNPVGLNKKSSISVLNGASLKVGKNTGFSNVSIYCALSITIGDNCKFGGNVFIWDTDFHELDYFERRKNIFNSQNVKSAPILIGDDVFIGANTIILKNTIIGNRAIIGAGSIVTKSVPADEIWAGNPAKFIRCINI